MLESAIFIRSGISYFIKMRMECLCLYVFLRYILLSLLSHLFKLKNKKFTQCSLLRYWILLFNQSHGQNLTFIVRLCCFWWSPTEVTSKWYQKILMPWSDASGTFILNRSSWPPEFWHWLHNITSHWPLYVFGDTAARCDLHVLVTTSVGLVRGLHQQCG
jgi:hypothetical protein